MELETITRPKRVQFDPLEDFFDMIRIFVKKEKSEDGKTIVEVTETNECIQLREDCISVAMERKIKDWVSSIIGNPERSITAEIKFYPVHGLYKHDMTFTVDPYLPYEDRAFESMDTAKVVFSVLEDIIAKYFPSYLKYYFDAIVSHPMVEFVYTILVHIQELEYKHKTGHIVINRFELDGFPTSEDRNKELVTNKHLLDLFFSDVYQYFGAKSELPPLDVSDVLINPDTNSHFVIDSLKLMNLLQSQIMELWYNEPDVDKIKEKDIPNRISHTINDMLYESLGVDETETDLHCVLNLPDSRVVVRMYDFSRLFSAGLHRFHFASDEYGGIESKSKSTDIFPFVPSKLDLDGISFKSILMEYSTGKSGNISKLTKMMQLTIAVLSNVLTKEYNVSDVDVLYYEIIEAWFYPESTTLKLIDEKQARYNKRIERVDLKHEINTFIPTIKTGEES